MNAEYNKKLNVQYLTHLTGGVRFHLYTTKKGEGGRFDGFRLRSVPIYDAFFKSLGANPVRMAPPAVYTALERGAVDGYGWPLWGIQDFGWDKYTKVRHDPGFISAAVAVLVNLDKWKSLDEGQRGCLNEMTLWLEEQWPAWREAENKVSRCKPRRNRASRSSSWATRSPPRPSRPTVGPTWPAPIRISWPNLKPLLTDLK
ncbi:MAG: hypothetical protein R3E68_21155 [Burkholderiaceae bacterium]